MTFGVKSCLIFMQKASTLSKLLNTPSGVSLRSSIRGIPQELNSSMGRTSLFIMADLQKSCLWSNYLFFQSGTLPQKSQKMALSVFSLLITLTSGSSLPSESLSSRTANICEMKWPKLSLKSYIIWSINLISFSWRPLTPYKLGERYFDKILLSSRRAESK